MVNRMTQHRSRAPLFLLYLKVIVIKNIHRDILNDQTSKLQGYHSLLADLPANPRTPTGRLRRRRGAVMPSLFSVPANEGCGTC